jgi:hypothetical protein
MPPLWMASSIPARAVVDTERIELLMNKKDAIKTSLNSEIIWHKKHPGGSACGESFENGFICGLKQARRILRKILKNAREMKKG